MAFEPLEFTKNWENSEDFPTYEPDESQVRADLQWLHNETRDGLNRLIAALNDPGAAAQLPFAPKEGLMAQNVQAAILEVYAAIQEAASGLLVDGTVTKEKLAQSLLERVYGGKVWASLDTPGAAQNPVSDFPVGQLWLRPGFAVENLARDTWDTDNCTVENSADGWLLTTDGSQETAMVVQQLDGVGKAGEKVWVRLTVSEKDDHLSELLLCLNDVEHDLMEGGGVFETVLDQSGSLEIMVWGSWPYAETGAQIRLSDLTVVDTDAVDGANSGCLPLSDWPGFLEQHAPFDRVEMPRILYVQEAPGLWAEVAYPILPVARGGTGLDAVAKGQLLYGSGDGLTVLDPPAEADSALFYGGGKPGWKTKAQVIETLGQLRLMTGTYTGSGDAATPVTLPVKPLLLHIRPEGGLDTSRYGTSHQAADHPTVLTDGAEDGNTNTYSTDTGYGWYLATVKLSGSTLTFSAQGGNQNHPDYMNRSGVKYHWTALY